MAVKNRITCLGIMILGLIPVVRSINVQETSSSLHEEIMAPLAEDFAMIAERQWDHEMEDKLFPSALFVLAT